VGFGTDESEWPSRETAPDRYAGEGSGRPRGRPAPQRCMQVGSTFKATSSRTGLAQRPARRKGRESTDSSAATLRAYRGDP